MQHVGMLIGLFSVTAMDTIKTQFIEAFGEEYRHSLAIVLLVGSIVLVMVLAIPIQFK